jgi:hypothetical protein
MGTSSSYKSPTGGGWTRAKSRMTRFARSSNDVEPRSVVSNYIHALGGSKGAVASAVGGQKVGQKFAGLITDVISAGLSTAFDERGISHLLGLDSESALYGIVDYLSGPTVSLEENVARSAIEEVMEDLLEECDWDMSQLGGVLNESVLVDLLEKFITEYVCLRLQSELCDRYDRGDITSQRAKDCELELKEFIEETIKLEFAQKDPLTIDWDGSEGANFIKELLDDAFNQIG